MSHTKKTAEYKFFIGGNLPPIEISIFYYDELFQCFR